MMVAALCSHIKCGSPLSVYNRLVYVNCGWPNVTKCSQSDFLWRSICQYTIHLIPYQNSVNRLHITHINLALCRLIAKNDNWYYDGSVYQYSNCFYMYSIDHSITIVHLYLFTKFPYHWVRPECSFINTIWFAQMKIWEIWFAGVNLVRWT